MFKHIQNYQKLLNMSKIENNIRYKQKNHKQSLEE